MITLKRHICCENYTRLAKICMAIFAPNERLPSSATLAHRYATFLCSWDVEIDDSLVWQLTALEVKQVTSVSDSKWHKWLWQ